MLGMEHFVIPAYDATSESYKEHETPTINVVEV